MTERLRVKPIELSIEAAVGADAAWRHLTEPALVALWLTDASPLGPVGARYRLDFGDGSVVVGEVLAVDPGHRLAYSWSWQGAGPGEITVVTWLLEPLPDDRTRVRIVHDGWEEAGVDASVRDDHEGYWSGYLDDLRDVLDEA